MGGHILDPIKKCFGCGAMNWKRINRDDQRGRLCKMCGWFAPTKPRFNKDEKDSLQSIF